MSAAHPPVFLFTDFGAEGPYLAQMEAAMLATAPELRVLNLLSDAPSANPRAAAYLLAALVSVLPADALIVAVVDPGVGTPRLPLLVEADGRRLVGPDNGLLAPVAAAAQRLRVWRIDWRPERLAPSFHGRDLFAPAAARLITGKGLPCTALRPDTLVGHDWPRQLAQIIYVDHFGNAYTGIAGADLAPEAVLHCAGQAIRHARVFAEVPRHSPFWYVNSCGLVEIAANQTRADRALGLAIGDPVTPGR
jgi:S-adenosylmethionine hydrolase